MKWSNGKKIINEVFDSWEDYEQVNNQSTDMIKRFLDSLHYGNKVITADELLHAFNIFEHCFEEDILNKIKNK